MTDEEVEKIIKSNMMLQMNLAGIRADFQEALAQPDQERVEWGVDWNKDGSCVSIIKRLPNGGIEVVAVEYGPQRTWVGLTKNEVETLSYQTEGNTWKAVELAEAKLKEKNK